MKSSFLQKLVNLASGLINNAINDQLPKVSAAIDTKIQAFNKLIAGEGANTFVFPVLGKDVELNMTMTHSPETVAGSDLIKLFFNGLFVSDKVSQNISDIVNYPPRINHSLSEQIWIHEDMFSSLFQAVGDQIFPISTNNADAMSLVLQGFPEIQAFYGQDIQAHLEVVMQNNGGKSINFDDKNGVIFGSQKAGETITTLKIVVSNSSVVNDTAVTFAMNLEADMNLTMKDFVFWPKFNEIFVANTKIIDQKIGLGGDHHYNIMFTSIL